MRIIVDGFGGDHAPLAVLQGCEMAVRELGVEILMTGDESILRKVAAEEKIDLTGITLVDAPLVMPMEAEPTKILSDYKESSMGKAFRLLADGEGDAMVCAGSTGAVVVGGSLIVKRIKGIKRPALASVIPANQGCYMLLDLGANVECRPEMLLQFGTMGSIYMQRIMNVENPKVALVNIGAEETKGGELQLGAYQLMSNAQNLNFVGNIEPRYIPRGDADVVVADGFTGNVILKLTEGLASMFSGQIKGIFKKNIMTKLAALLVMKGIKAFKQNMDYTEYGGAPLLGTAKPVIKAHGSSNAKAFKNAIRQAANFAERDVIGEISQAVAAMKQSAE